MDIALCITLPALAMWVGHWFPWRRMLGDGLPRFVAYLYGVGAILLTVTLVTVWAQPTWLGGLLYLWIAAASAGLATGAAYAVDAVIDNHHLRRDVRDRVEHYGQQK